MYQMSPRKLKVIKGDSVSPVRDVGHVASSRANDEDNRALWHDISRFCIKPGKVCTLANKQYSKESKADP